MQNDSFIFRWFSKVGPFCALSIIWLLMCLPVVTIIPACVSLYDSVVHCLHGNEEAPVRRFFHTLKNELLRGIALSVLFLVIGFLLFYGYRITAVFATGSLSSVYSMLYAGTMLIPLGILAWVIPIQARFDYPFGELLYTSLAMSFTNLPTTAIILGIFLLTLFIMLLLPPMIVLAPGICVTIQAFFIEKVFKKYIEKEGLAEES